MTLTFSLLEQPLLQDALGAELAAAMDDRDALGEIGQVERLLDRGIAAADHRRRPCRDRRSRRRWRRPTRRSPEDAARSECPAIWPGRRWR